MEAKEIKMVYDTLLSAPGMEQNVKVDLKLNRKTALFLVTAIERGLGTVDIRQNDLITLSEQVTGEELQQIASDILEKAGLSEMHRKLTVFRGK